MVLLKLKLGKQSLEDLSIGKHDRLFHGSPSVSVEIYQFGPKWLTVQPTDRQLTSLEPGPSMAKSNIFGMIGILTT